MSLRMFLVGFGIMVLTSVIRGLLPKVPTWALVWVSAALGAAGETGMALMNGTDWQTAIMQGLMSGVLASGMYAGGAKWAIKPVVSKFGRQPNEEEAPAKEPPEVV